MVTVSLCMIVKNEEEVLDRCLTSVNRFVDEIVIVDTGSSDQTKRIARKWTKKIYDFKWVHDFSLARDFSFKKGTKDFLFWLDADDVVTPENLEKLLLLKQKLSLSTDGVTMRYIVNTDSNGNVVDFVRRLRMVKNGGNWFRWEGIVHEDLKVDSHFSPSVIESKVDILHQKMKTTTKKRNLEIYNYHLAQGKAFTLSDTFHYGLELVYDRQYEKAVLYLEEFLQVPEGDSSWRILAYNGLAICYHQLGDLEKELEITLQSFKEDIPKAEFCCRVAEHFMRRKKITSSIFWYELALTVPQKENATMSSSEPFRTWHPHKQLTHCHIQLRNYEKAYTHCQKTLQFNPHDEQSLQYEKYLKSKLIIPSL